MVIESADAGAYNLVKCDDCTVLIVDDPTVLAAHERWCV